MQNPGDFPSSTKPATTESCLIKSDKTKRFILPGQPQHVIQRGNNRQAIFCTEGDYHYYLEKLEYAAKEHDCRIHAYVQMTNHVHLLVSPSDADGLSKMM